MRKAGEITEAAYAATLPKLRHGMTNLDLISEVNYQLQKHGARTNSFVTSFYNMGVDYPFDFTNREEVLQAPLDAPVSVSFDFGAVYGGYCYDYGRSVFFGDPGRRIPPRLRIGHAVPGRRHRSPARRQHMRTGRRRRPRRHRGGRLRPRLPASVGPRHRHRRARSPLPHRRRHDRIWRPACASPPSQASSCPATWARASRTSSSSASTAVNRSPAATRSCTSWSEPPRRQSHLPKHQVGGSG